MTYTPQGTPDVPLCVCVCVCARAHTLCICVLVSLFKSCLTLHNPMDCSMPGSFVQGILQARILEWVAIPFSRGSSQPKDQTCISCTAGTLFTAEAPGKPLRICVQVIKRENTRLQAALSRKMD